jgi:hypothetical protein
MSRLLERLKGINLTLLSPPGAGNRPSQFAVGDISRFRAAIYAECASLPPDHRADADAADQQAWHLVATSGPRILGCIRLIVYAEAQRAAMPRAVLANSQCQFSKQDQATCLAVLEDYGQKWGKLGGPLVQAGGLAVASDMRRSIVGPALCLAGNAFIRGIGGVTGVVFAAEKTGGVSLYAKAGCTPLQCGDSALGYFDDPFHRDRILVMGISPWSIEADLDAAVVALGGKLDRGAPRLETTHTAAMPGPNSPCLQRSPQARSTHH